MENFKADLGPSRPTKTELARLVMRTNVISVSEAQTLDRSLTDWRLTVFF